MKHLLYPLAFSLLVVTGCGTKESEAPLVLTGEYQAQNTVLTAPIIMYTRDGAVNNPALVDRFLSRRTWATRFTRTDTPIPTTSSLTLLIAANKRATLASNSPGRSDTIKTEITGQQSKYLVLSAQDSVSVLTAPSNANRCEQLGAQMEVEQPVKRCVAVPMTSGTFEKICRFRPIRLLQIDAGNLYIPQLSWIVQSGNPQTSICGLSYGGQWNLLNPAVLNQLAAGDTLVVQERRIALVRK